MRKRRGESSLPPGIAKFLRYSHELGPGDILIDLLPPRKKQKPRISTEDTRPDVSTATNSEDPEHLYPLDQNTTVSFTLPEVADAQPWPVKFSDSPDDLFGDDFAWENEQTMVGYFETLGCEGHST